MGQQLPAQHVATVGSSEASRLHQLDVHPINTSQTSLLEGLIHAMFYTHVHTMCDPRNSEWRGLSAYKTLEEPLHQTSTLSNGREEVSSGCHPQACWLSLKDWS